MKSQAGAAPVTVDETDRAAARQAPARNWPDVEQDSPKYKALLEGLAQFHRLVGADSFELRYNLRCPQGREEKWTKQFMQGQITEDEFREN